MFGELRVTRNEKGELLFCLKDVCDSFGLQVGATAKRLGQQVISSINVLTNGGSQQMYFVTEPDLYRCIFQSRKPTARKFKIGYSTMYCPLFAQQAHTLWQKKKTVRRILSPVA